VTGTNWPKPTYTLLVTGLCRFKVDELLQESPYLVAKVTQLDKLENDQGMALSIYSLTVKGLSLSHLGLNRLSLNYDPQHLFSCLHRESVF